VSFCHATGRHKWRRERVCRVFRITKVKVMMVEIKQRKATMGGSFDDNPNEEYGNPY
jgi:hypothetical protein